MTPTPENTGCHSFFHSFIYSFIHLQFCSKLLHFSLYFRIFEAWQESKENKVESWKIHVQQLNITSGTPAIRFSKGNVKALLIHFVHLLKLLLHLQHLNSLQNNLNEISFNFSSLSPPFKKTLALSLSLLSKGFTVFKDNTHGAKTGNDQRINPL